MGKQNDSTLLYMTQCPTCKANGRDTDADNLGVYDDDHAWCFAGCGIVSIDSLGDTKGTTTVPQVQEERSFNRVAGEVIDLPQRGLYNAILKKFGYRIGDYTPRGLSVSSKWHVADYYKDGKLVAQHLRGKDKSFRWIGDTKSIELFGQHLWKNDGRGKRLVITEGELDAMSVCQVLGGTWPVVSVPNGASSALKYILQNLEFVDSYAEVVLAFDMDKPGQEAAQLIAETLKPGKCKIASLPCKDPNECLVQNKTKDLLSSIWEAQVYSPDEILHVRDVIAQHEITEETKVYPFPFDTISEFLIGQRSHEITLYCSGSGSGKSTFIRELGYAHLMEGRSVGAIMLEESPKETLDDMTSLVLSKPVRSIIAGRMMNNLRSRMGKEPIVMDIIDNLTDEEYADAQKKLAATGFYIYDHLGNNAMACLLSRMEYMAVSLGVDVILLDHITAAAAGLMGITNKDFEGGGAERLIIDNMMKDMRSLAVRTGVHIDIVSQLKKTDKAFEEGARITMQDLRGSGSLGGVPNTVIALERDRQNVDDIKANTTIVRVLKNRLTGRAGVASCLYFNRLNNRMQEIDWSIDDKELILDPQFEMANEITV